MGSQTRVELFFEQFSEQIQQQSSKRWFSSKDKLGSSSACPDSLLMMASSVRGASGTQQHPGHTAFPVVSQWQSSHVEKLKEHFAQRKKKKTHECHLLSFVFSWLMEFLFLTCTCKPILPRYKLFWFFTTITSCSSCLDCWRSSMILMSVLWEAAFPWVSFYILQGYLYT